MAVCEIEFAVRYVDTALLLLLLPSANSIMQLARSYPTLPHFCIRWQ
jgi:hypothetical protein